MILKKKCIKCEKSLSLLEFGKRKNSSDGYRNICKLCQNVYMKEYYHKNKNKINEQRKEYLKNYYTENTEKIKDQTKKYRMNNINEIKIKKIKYHKSNVKYDVYKNKLTIDEDPKISDDGISLEVKCRYCGKYFKPLYLQIQNRLQSLNGVLGDNGLYCSEGCKQACPIFNQSKYPKGQEQATSREVQPQLRQIVLERDNYICQKCGSIDELHCHHKWPLNESPITSADIDECITLCIDCHKEVHMNVAGCGYHEMRCSA